MPRNGIEPIPIDFQSIALPLSYLESVFINKNALKCKKYISHIHLEKLNI